MTRPFLTVLTTPIHSGPRRLYRGARRLARHVVKPGVPLPQSSPYPGHHALVRSVVEGLRAIHADFNFNPSTRAARPGRLRARQRSAAAGGRSQAARRVDYLVAGPVNALFADECDAVLQTPGIDLLIIASEWVRSFYRDVPSLAARSRVCPAGVDSGDWQPTGRPRERTAIVYWKSGEESACQAVETTIRECGLEPIRIESRPGEHRLFEPAEYRDRLDRAALGVFLSTFETQGIALAEAWSMNVPTMVWDPKGDAEWRGRRFTRVRPRRISRRQRAWRFARSAN